MTYRCVACEAPWPSVPSVADPGRCGSCGSTNVTQFLGVEDNLARQMRESVSIGTQSMATGRRAWMQEDGVTNPHFQEVVNLVQDLAEGEGEVVVDDVLAAHPVAVRIREELSGLKRPTLTGTYVRARRFPVRAATVERRELLANPKPAVERFNPPGRRALYLARDVGTAARERPATEECPRLFLLNFRFDEAQLPNVKLELSDPPSARLLNTFLALCERTIEEAPWGSNVYRPTFFLRALCDGLGILALEYPSVRAPEPVRPHPMNLVVFEGVLAIAEACAEAVPFEILEPAGFLNPPNRLTAAASAPRAASRQGVAGVVPSAGQP